MNWERFPGCFSFPLWGRSPTCHSPARKSGDPSLYILWGRSPTCRSPAHSPARQGGDFQLRRVRNR